MSIHARSQLFLIRPTLSRGVTRNLPTTASRRIKSLAVRNSPTRLSSYASRNGNVVAIGAFLSAGVAAVLTHEAALCESMDVLFSKVDDNASNGKPSDRRGSLKDEIDLIIDQLTSRFGEISLAGGLGFCSGYALKQVGKVAAATIGTLFVIAQVAQAKGYIEINWQKVEKDVVKAVDPDGDGKITKKDLHEWYKKLMTVLQANLPSSAGFAGGFLLGVSCS